MVAPGFCDLFEELRRTVSGEVRARPALEGALLDRRERLPDRAAAVVVLPRTEARRRGRRPSLRPPRGPAHGEGRRHVAGRPVDRAGVILDSLEVSSIEIARRSTPRRTSARVRPGCVLDDLNRGAQAARPEFAPDISTASRATIGGMVANNSSGARSVIYGKTSDHVLAKRRPRRRPGDRDRPARRRRGRREVRGRGPGGRGVQGRPKARGRPLRRDRPTVPENPQARRRLQSRRLFRPGSGTPFDLTRLFVGSEGTLGVVVEATLRLVERPEAKAVLVVQFDDLLEALAATPLVLTHRPAAVEVIDHYVLDSTKLNPEASTAPRLPPGRPRRDPRSSSSTRTPGATCRRGSTPSRPTSRPARPPSGSERRTARRRRGSGSFARWRWASRWPRRGTPRPSRSSRTRPSPRAAARLHRRVPRRDRRHGTKAGVYAHASVGCLHVRPVVNLKTVEGVQEFEAIAAEVAGLVLKYGGALCGEHGDGLVRSPFQERMYGPELYQAFRELKRSFDPHRPVQPGKIVDAPPLTTSLRFGSAYVTPDVRRRSTSRATAGCSARRSFARASARCRKRRQGTMCPSYQATRDERDGARGRANAYGWRSPARLGSRPERPGGPDALDLCLECKACKAECPTNVDMARLKAEVLHQSFKERGVPWRNRFFGNVDRISRWGSRLAPVSNWAARGTLGRWLNDRLLGIDRRRLPPAFARDTFRARFASRRPTTLRGGGRSYSSRTRSRTFMSRRSAWRRPTACGGRLPGNVGPPDLRCCGRPQISNGLLDRAVELARHNVARLHERVAKGWPIVACEPSCLAHHQGRLPGPAWRGGQDQGVRRRRRLFHVRGVP